MDITATDRTDAPFTRRGCPNDEMLLAYLLATLVHDEQGRITTHIGSCDSCVDNLTAMQHRLAIAAEVPLAVPAAIMARLQPDGSERRAPIVRLASAQRAAPQRRTLREVLDAWLRLPIVIPSGVALGALLFVAVHTWVSPDGARTLMRSVDIQQSARINVRAAEVRAEPDARATVVGTLTRGQIVTVDVQQRDWCRVAVPSGLKGWVDCGVFR